MADIQSQNNRIRGRFTKQTVFDFPVESVFSWHEKDGAIERLSPPWDPIRVVHKSGGIQPGATVVLGMQEGPFKYLWHAVHTDYEKDRLFRDEQVKGPLSSWVHTHRFDPLDENQCTLEDTIEYKPYLSFISQFLADHFVQKKLSRIFAYRHRTTAADLALHARFQHLPRKRVLISGASGLLGQRLVPFLRTGGHTVFSLVRRQPRSESEIHWNPAKGILNPDDLQDIDVIMHLSGENVGEGRWTAAKRRRIIESRLSTTGLLARTAASVNPKPAVFISASATGYYGNSDAEFAGEDAPPGDGFLASVCKQWEDAAQPAGESGIRTVIMRIGVVITPEGGALQKLLLPYKLGLGGRIGPGSQYISWIGIDDTLASFYWAMMNEDISGPINVVSPEPVTYYELSKTLAAVLKRPAMLPLPSFLIKLLFGQMGVEGLLYSTRTRPDRLLNTGFYFRHSKLEEVFKHVLGKQ